MIDIEPQIKPGQPFDLYIQLIDGDGNLLEQIDSVRFTIGQLDNLYIDRLMTNNFDTYELHLNAEDIDLFNNGVQMYYEIQVKFNTNAEIVYARGPISFIPDDPDYALSKAELNRVLTQYRESPKLLSLMRNYLNKIEDIYFAIKDLPSYFEIDTAVGDQLTLIGKRLGWPRDHCVCIVQPVFGFACPEYPDEFPIVGFCEDSTWVDCGAFGIGTIALNDDEMYRAFLRARRYQILSFYDIESLTDALQTFYGSTAWVIDAGHGRVVLAPGRLLTAQEKNVLQLVPRVLPVAPGIRTRFHFDIDPRVFGFGDGWGGFCEPWIPDGLLLGSDGDIPIGTETGFYIGTGPLTRGAPWLCEIDVKPYECA